MLPPPVWLLNSKFPRVERLIRFRASRWTTNFQESCNHSCRYLASWFNLIGSSKDARPSSYEQAYIYIYIFVFSFNLFFYSSWNKIFHILKLNFIICKVEYYFICLYKPHEPFFFLNRTFLKGSISCRANWKILYLSLVSWKLKGSKSISIPFRIYMSKMKFQSWV